MGAVPIGLVFPGQGTQREGMGEPWRGTEAWALVPEISRRTGEDVEELVLRTPTEQLRRTDLAQLAIFTVSVLALREAERRGLTEGAVACAGHSRGQSSRLEAGRRILALVLQQHLAPLLLTELSVGHRGQAAVHPTQLARRADQSANRREQHDYR